MTLSRQIGTSVIVQGTGAASVLIATFWIGRSWGPDVQGDFSRVKAEIEFVAAVAMLGLPQALFYFVTSRRLAVRKALHCASATTLLALAAGSAYGMVRASSVDAPWAAALGVAIALCVAHGQLRALVLATDRAAWFNSVTALPQWVALAGAVAVAWLVALPSWTWPSLFALAYGCGVALAWSRLRRVAQEQITSPVGLRALGSYGVAAWLTAGLSAAAILLVQFGVEENQGSAALGRFTMAMTLLQVPLTPISYAGPLLFRRWVEHPATKALGSLVWGTFSVLLTMACIVWVCAAWWPSLGLGEAYFGTTEALALLLVGAAAEAATRLLTVSANASGLPWLAVRSEAARWFALGVVWLVTLPTTLLSACAAWVAGSWAAAAVFAVHALCASRKSRSA